VDHHDAVSREQLITLSDLGLEVTALLDLDRLLRRIPELVARLVEGHAAAVYLLDDRGAELAIASSVGYPEDAASRRLAAGEGLVGAAVAEGRALLVNDAPSDPRYIEIVPGSQHVLAVPLFRQGQVIGALNLLSDSRPFTAADEAILAEFGSHVAVALGNARLFEQAREHTATLETLTEIAREVASTLDLEQRLSRIAILVKRVIDYRIFGILLLNEDTGELEPKVQMAYGERAASWPNIRLGDGLVGYAALHKEPVLVDDVHEDPRYVRIIEDVRSELVIPLLLKDRCLGVFDLESPEPKAFSRHDVEILNVLASQAAIAIENARLYEVLRDNEVRLEREVDLAQRVQEALLPTELPRRVRGVDVAVRFVPARKVAGDLYDFLSPEPGALVVAVGDVTGKGVPAALYSSYISALVRSRTLGRRYAEIRQSPAAILGSVNTILHQRQLERYFCTLCYAHFDFRRRLLTVANSGLPYPIRVSGEGCTSIEVAGVPLGTFAGSTYEETTVELKKGDLYVFCSDGVFEAADAEGQEFGEEGLRRILLGLRDAPAQGVVDGILAAVEKFRGPVPQGDDMTVVVLKLTA
jgi:phosphoserine phosphatase RsbU/P